jgi:NAD(P) transhydrogenase subunit alpha
MTVGILKEPISESRVAMLPAAVQALKDMGVAEVVVETGAGIGAFAPDADYTQAGARVALRPEALQSDIVIAIHPPALSELSGTNAVLVSVFEPLGNNVLVNQLLTSRLTTFSMDIVPRTTRAQSMDILSSMATVSGYKAVLLAAWKLPKFFPMFMTAAGSIVPAKVLVLGAGVAGLQAIATSRKLGAVVEAFDVRSAVREEVMSLGAKFVEVEGSKEDVAAGGYAVEQSEEFKRLQQKAIHDHAVKSDVVIATAQIPGRKAPVLLPKETVEAMKPGSVIVDLAALSGGNCALTKAGEEVIHNGVLIIGHSNLPGTAASDASRMFGKNLVNFLKLIIKDGQLNLNFEDDIVRETCVTHNGEVMNSRLRQPTSVST